MALNDITFIKGQGGLGRPLAGEDYISGLLFYSGSLPSCFTSTRRIKQVFSVEDAEALGITNTSSDATAAAFTLLITNKGANGDTLNISFTEIDTTVDLGTYTKVSGDSTTAAVATAIAAVVNAGTYSHGYTASVNTSTVTITCPKKLGIYPNTGTPAVVTMSGGSTIAYTLTQPSAATVGVASQIDILHYHISEYFRIQPKGNLYVGVYAVPGSYTFEEVALMQNYANGAIRQIGIFKDTGSTFASGNLTTIHNYIVANCDANHKPLSALYASDLSGTADLTTLTNLQTLSANKVSAVISQDGAAKGWYLFNATGKSITTLGACLGAVSLAAVSDDIAWIGKFNISDGSECDTIAFANGTLCSTLSQGTLNQLDNYRYIFLTKYVGLAGSYFNDSHCAIIETSDYAYIENNRTIDKAIRGIYSSVLPALNSPLVLNADGTLTDETIAYFTSLAELNLTQMIRDSELSAQKVSIDSTQDVLSTNQLVIGVQLLPIGVARNIVVKIAFTTKIQ